MKKKTIIIIMSAAIVLSTELSACSLIKPSASQSATDEAQNQTELSAEARIKELESKISALLQTHQLSESERQKEIAALKSELEELKKDDANKDDDEDDKTDADSGDKTDEDEKQTEKQDAEVFKYSLSSGVITITAIISEEENLVIPSSIDGYRVYAIGSEALSSGKVKSITISPGIEKLDWFAFKNCPSLSSVSIPDSVSSIGYGAFDNASSSLIIRCARDSFAHRYSQSYGLTYDIS